MTDTPAIWLTEQSFWLDGPAFFERSMAPEALMVFPAPVGILQGRMILDGLAGAPRWQSVALSDRHMVSRGDTLALAYRATGQRKGDTPYSALCSSTYCRSDDRWMLIAHQQTPLA